MKKSATLVVIGGGAGGFFCALNAASSNQKCASVGVEDVMLRMLVLISTS